MIPMNRGHIYLEMWLWLVNSIEDEPDEEKRARMYTVQIALAQGLDKDLGAQYGHGSIALDTARKLNLDIIAANIDHMLHDYMYHEYQPSPIDEAEFEDAFCDPRTPEQRAADEDWQEDLETRRDLLAGLHW